MSDIPQIACKSHDVVAEMGDHVTLSCEVRASPSATVDWYFGTDNETLDNSTDVDSWTVATKVRLIIIIVRIIKLYCNAWRTSPKPSFFYICQYCHIR